MPEVRRNFIWRILELRSFLVVNLIILMFLTLSFGREFVRDYRIQQEIDNLRMEAEELEVHNLEIAKLNAELETETFLEEEARLKLGLLKPGEQLVVVVDEGVAGAPVIDGGDETVFDFVPSVSQEEEINISNPKRWWYYFFDHNKYQTIKIYGL